MNTIGDMDDAQFSQFLQEREFKPANTQEHFDPNAPLSPIDCTTDLAIWKRCIEEAQTTLYRHATKLQVDSAFDAAFKACQAAPSYLEMLRLISKTQHLIACGHSGWSHSDAYKKHRNTAMRFFPLEVVNLQNSLYIKSSFSSNPAIEKGAEITRINGVETKEVLKKLRAHVNHDGQSNPEQTLTLSRYFSMAYSNFIENPKSFELEILSYYATKPIKVKAAALSLSTIDSLRREATGIQNANSQMKPLQFETIDTASVGRLTLRSFNKAVIQHHKQHFEPFIDSVFNTLDQQNLEYLIIDLRGNSGGWTAYGNYLFSHFVAPGTPYIQSVEALKTKDYSFAPIANTLPPYHDTMVFEQGKNNRWTWTNYPSLVTCKTKAPSFKGKVYVLIDGLTRSCSNVFSSLIRSNTDAVFIGTETGAAQNGAGAMVVGIVLPYTGISIHFSTAAYQFAVNDMDNNKGVIPDREILPVHPLPPSSIDRPMHYVMDRINSSAE